MLLGLVASTAVVVGGALSGAAEPGEGSIVWSVPRVPVRPTFPLLPALIFFYGGLVLLTRSWFLLRRYHLFHRLTIKTVATIIFIWSLPLLIGPPLGSRDVYAYAAQGRAAEQGFDVYVDGPSVLGSEDPVLAPVDPIYHESPVVYGPVFVTMSAWVAKIAGEQVVAAILLFRVLALGGVLAAAVAVFDIARRLGRDPVDAVTLGVANPLVLLHLISGAHNEAIMLAFLLGGVAIGMREKFRFVGLAFCAFAAAIKLPAVLGAAFIAAPWILSAASWPLKFWRACSSGAVVVGVVALAGQLTGWGWGWVDAISGADPVDAYLSVTTLGGAALSKVTGLDRASVLSAARALGYLLAIGSTVFLLLRNNRSWLEALAWSLFIAAVFHPTTQPWYLTWSMLLFAAISAGQRSRHVLIVGALTAFTVLPSGPKLGWILLDDAGVWSLGYGLAAVLLLTMSPKFLRSFSLGSAIEESSNSLATERSLSNDLVSLIVPVRAGAQRSAKLVSELQAVLNGRRAEILLVADSDHPEISERLDSLVSSSQDSAVDIRMVTRSQPAYGGGGGGAILDGLAQAQGANAVVVDPDLTHSPAAVPELIKALDTDDLAIASRCASSEAAAELGWSRRWPCYAGRLICRILFGPDVRRVSDPLSELFAVRLRNVQVDSLHADGSKVLVELLATHGDLRISEVPLKSVERQQGYAKITVPVACRFLAHMVELFLRRSWPWAASPTPRRIFPLEGVKS